MNLARWVWLAVVVENPAITNDLMVDQVVTQQAYMMSTIDYFWVLGWGFMALIIIIWFTRPPFVKSGMPGAPAAGH